ncbi:MAG: hypothetical protein AAGB05_14130 [Pseudomonadota bacterium]
MANTSGVSAAGTTIIAVNRRTGRRFVDDRIRRGGALQGSVTWRGESLARLGLDPGDCVYTILGALTFPAGQRALAAAADPAGVDAFTVRIGARDVIPLAAAGLLLIDGLRARALARRS